ncbi:tetratricopeptide repeat protein [Actinokineospora terrae]|uniref:non-specific serine/threonine protein kinase n=1 Tax=Actinokineospora terrae TaxID=155974 RepID=A0A1H9XPF3_9PSEU|nr:tetratricopeptide repeat protein [Actinokineospora terrae]SES48040.1 serine/threonine-protein kinase PknG [Actinokineospora terrae]
MVAEPAEPLLHCGVPVSPTGYCDECGRKVSPRTVVPTTDRPAFWARGSSATREVSAVLPPARSVNPVDRLGSATSYPTDRQFCGNPRCGKPVGQGFAGQPPLMEGFCGSCRLAFSFTPKLHAGDLVEGRYAVLGTIARGGLGWIYLARDTRLGDNHVVLKGVINSSDVRALELAAVERDTLIRLDHENIVRIVDFVGHPRPDRPDGPVDEYIVMEYLAGRTLAEVVLDPAGLRLEHVLAYAERILAAIGHLHDTGLLYCDMSPSNVMHTGSTVKVIDLGATRPVEDKDTPPVHTRGFSVDANEIKVHGVTVRSDIYAIGQTLRALLQAVPADPDGAEKSLSRLLDRATAAHGARFPSVAAMREQLDAVGREIRSLQDGSQRPARSTWFAESADLLDGGLGVVPGLAQWARGVPGFEPTPPPLAEIAVRLPAPAIAQDDPAVTFLSDLVALDPGALLRKLDQTGAATPEIAFCRVRAHLRRHETEQASAALSRATDLLGGSSADDWRTHWHTGLMSLAEGDTGAARTSFNQVYTMLPGEDAPKLALALCCEHLGAQHLDEAWWLHHVVLNRDHAQANAAFGLARLALRDHERATAIKVLDQVPRVSRHHDAANVAAVRVLSARLGDRDPTPADLADAAVRAVDLFDDVDDGGESRDRLTLVVLHAAFTHVLAGRAFPLPDDQDPARAAKIADVLGDPVAESGLRARMEDAYRRLAKCSRLRLEHGTLVDLANTVREMSRW